MKVRHLCATFGIAVAVGAVVFMRSLVATNDYQSVAVAERLFAELPVDDVAHTTRLALDYRPDGRVMQGPPLTAVVGTKPHVDGIVLTKAVFAQRRLQPPPVGTTLTLVGRRRAYRLKVSAILDWTRPLGRGAAYPTAFVSPETAQTIGEEWRVFERPTITELAPSFTSDAGRNFDRAKALLLWAAALTALCLLVNTLFLSVEARRRELAILRTLGLTRGGVVRLVTGEAVGLALAGWALGIVVACGALAVYVSCEAEVFPLGVAYSFATIGASALLTPILAVFAALLALKPALAVKPLEAASAHVPRRRTIGMLLSFAFGFGGFVAVEVWGASLMKAFVPSAEWPDAIVSVLPGGVSSFEIEKLKGIEGVARIAELQPLQVNLLPLEALETRRPVASGSDRKHYRNALLLASDHLPVFRFSAGTREDACARLQSGDTCIITEMMARARGWALGDTVALDCGRGHSMKLTIVGIVDLNWHMVTSRGLVRGLNRMPSNTDGPLFVSFDTLAACDARPQHVVPMTHLWLDYKPEFLAEHGVFQAGRLVEKEIAKILTPNPSTLTPNPSNTVRLHARDEIADGTLAHGSNLIGAMARVPFIFIAVVSLGFIAMLVASVESRRREFRVLRAVGATRLQVSVVLVREAVAVAVKGMIFGLLGGALAGWLFTFSTRKLMANWGLPPSFAVPWETLAWGAAGALVFALLVVLPTALMLINRSCQNRQPNVRFTKGLK